VQASDLAFFVRVGGYHLESDTVAGFLIQQSPTVRHIWAVRRAKYGQDLRGRLVGGRDGSISN
jgi:hypothetical protein